MVRGRRARDVGLGLALAAGQATGRAPTCGPPRTTSPTVPGGALAVESGSRIHTRFPGRGPPALAAEHPARTSSGHEGGDGGGATGEANGGPAP